MSAARTPSEAEIKAQILLRVGSRPGVRLFNNPVGSAWVGEAVGRPGSTILLARPRRVTFGLAPGSHDLIGYTEVVVTPEMVGQRLAVFTSLEIKAARGVASAEQINWAAVLEKAGARVGIVRSEDEALAVVRGG